MQTDNTPQIDQENFESVQRVDSLLTLIAKIMVARDLRAKEAKKEETDDGDWDRKTTNQPDKV
jgi:hypothetical protein